MSPKFTAKRVTRLRVQHYSVPPAEVFPWHWAIDEQEWAVGFEIETVYPAGGPPVEGAVFVTHQGGAEQVWVLTEWNPVAGRICYVHVTARRDVTEIRIQVSGPVQGPTQVTVTYTWTGLSPEGNAFVESQTEESVGKWMDEWEEELAHFLRTGRKLARP